MENLRPRQQETEQRGSNRKEPGQNVAPKDICSDLFV